MNKGSIVERLCSDLIAKSRDINGLLYFIFTFRIADRTAKNCRGHVTYATTTFRENYLCARSAFLTQSCVLNLKSLAQVVFEILRSKCIGETSLTFQGYVTSSVMWPFDNVYVISYWWSIGAKPLSVTVSEIFNVKCSVIVDVTLIRHLNKGQGHSFWYQSISHIRLPIGSQ